jgi:hypothetical protein
MNKSLFDLYYEFLALGHEKQQRLVQLVDENSTYTVDYKTQQLEFSDGLKFNFTLLGSESFEENSWLWAWANENLKLSGCQLEASSWFKRFGISGEIETFVQPMFQLGGDWSAQEIALISTGLSDFGAFFRHPQKYGAYYLLLDTTESLENAVKDDLATYNSCLTDCSMLYDDGSNIDIAKYYLNQKNVNVSVNKNVLTAEKNGKQINLEFDSNGRIVNGSVSL